LNELESSREATFTAKAMPPDIGLSFPVYAPLSDVSIRHFVISAGGDGNIAIKCPELTDGGR